MGDQPPGRVSGSIHKYRFVIVVWNRIPVNEVCRSLKGTSLSRWWIWRTTGGTPTLTTALHCLFTRPLFTRIPAGIPWCTAGLFNILIFRCHDRFGLFLFFPPFSTIGPDVKVGSICIPFFLIQSSCLEMTISPSSCRGRTHA